MCIYSLGVLKLEKRDLFAGFFDQWSRACVKKLASFDSQMLANSVYGIALLKLDPMLIPVLRISGVAELATVRAAPRGET